VQPQAAAGIAGRQFVAGQVGDPQVGDHPTVDPGGAGDGQPGGGAAHRDRGVGGRGQGRGGRATAGPGLVVGEEAQQVRVGAAEQVAADRAARAQPRRHRRQLGRDQVAVGVGGRRVARLAGDSGARQPRGPPLEVGRLLVELGADGPTVSVEGPGHDGVARRAQLAGGDVRRRHRRVVDMAPHRHRERVGVGAGELTPRGDREGAVVGRRLAEAGRVELMAGRAADPVAGELTGRAGIGGHGGEVDRGPGGGLLARAHRRVAARA
jgi:hypothetical protein